MPEFQTFKLTIGSLVDNEIDFNVEVSPCVFQILQKCGLFPLTELLTSLHYQKQKFLAYLQIRDSQANS